MKPKQTSAQKRETSRRKNRIHWTMHKHKITERRNEKQLENFRQHLDSSMNQNEFQVHYPVTDMTGDAEHISTFLQSSVHQFNNVDVVDKLRHDSNDSISNNQQSYEDHEVDDDMLDESDQEDEIQEDIDFDDLYFQTTFNKPFEREYDELDISVALMMIKKKHKCTNNLIMDILALLKSLRIPKVPSSWQRLKSFLMAKHNSSFTDQQRIEQTIYFCPQCEQESTSSSKCTNSKCTYFVHTAIRPHKFLLLNIQQQLEQILKSMDRRNLHLSAQLNESDSMADITDGPVYCEINRSLQNEHHRSFISLVCNVDGAAVYTSSEQSMWTIIGCINEFPRSIRFDVDKIIVFGISVGCKKPSRFIMQKMLRPIVERLKALQQPNLYQLSNTYEILRVYLIGISNDKPANSLVQNQSEPNAIFGCSRCEIEGETTPAKFQATPNNVTNIITTYVRIFPTSADEPNLRSNDRWCEISHAIRNGVQFFTKKNKPHTFGYFGDCVFSDLAFVDRGRSFMADTLHSIYHGAFKRLLMIWTESSKKEPFSLCKSLMLIDQDLSRIMYPSTTTRSPRSIRKALKLKANECRVLLMIAYPIFKLYLPDAFYRHLQKLAFGIHIGESTVISSNQLSRMEELLSSFVDDFPYNKRHIVQTVHCVKHFAITAKDFGPLSNYSTFNFESIIGFLTASIHGTKELGAELAVNLELFKKAHHSSTTHCLSSSLFPFIQYLKYGRSVWNKQQPINDNITAEDIALLHTIIRPGSTIKPMKSSWHFHHFYLYSFCRAFRFLTNSFLTDFLVVIDNLVLSTRSSSRSKTFSDSYIVFMDDASINYGCIEKIFYVTEENNYLIKVKLLQDIHFDYLLLNGKKYVNHHIIYGHFLHDHFRMIPGTHVIEKGCFFAGNDSFFAKFPNLYESS